MFGFGRGEGTEETKDGDGEGESYACCCLAITQFLGEDEFEWVISWIRIGHGVGVTAFDIWHGVRCLESV